jgi:hypothetical protein
MIGQPTKALVKKIRTPRQALERHRALAYCLSMISAQTLCVCREAKPVSTFPDHGLACRVSRTSPPHLAPRYARLTRWIFDPLAVATQERCLSRNRRATRCNIKSPATLSLKASFIKRPRDCLNRHSLVINKFRPLSTIRFPRQNGIADTIFKPRRQYARQQ